MNRRHRRLKWALTILVILLLTVGFSLGFHVLGVSNWQLLDPAKLIDLAQTGVILDQHGQYVTTLVGKENRTIIDVDALPDHVRNAFLAAEDLRFYKHPGFDVIRIAGAAAANARTGGYGQGASTITQQLVKLSHLSSQKTIARKLEEIWLAVQVEHRYTKDEILGMYLNIIYFGQGAYGVQAAAQATFGVDAADLTPAQAASLAASIKAPSAFSLQNNAAANADRRRYILQTMRDNDMLTTEAYEEAVAEELVPLQSSQLQTDYGWFIDAVLDEAELQLDVSAETLLAGGYTITTTLDPSMQATLDAQFTKKDLFPANAKDGKPVQAAAACVDTSSGAVRAIVGGREYVTRRGLNRATQLKRQPGSSLKPLAVYAPAIEYANWTCASVILDEPTDFGSYRPKNAGNAYYGNVTVRTALKNSLNIPACKVMQAIGVPACRRYLQSVGIELDDRDANLSLALGAMTYGTSPVAMAAAYSPFANGGRFYDPYFIESIRDSSGAVVYQHQDAGNRVLSEQSAYLMTNLLRTVITNGTGTRLSGVGTPIAGKTGTVNMTGGGNRDAWMVAYTPEVSCAVWMGFDEPDANHRLSSSVSGGTNPASLARDFFKSYYANRKRPEFVQPSGIVTASIDKKAIEVLGEPLLATNLTPETYRLKEIFKTGTQPTRESSVWHAPQAARSFYVSHTEAGQPLLVIEPSESAIYRVQRDAVGESFILTELRGSTGETLYYADASAVPGVVYTYRVIPVHAELLQGGILLEGTQSVQVAQVRRTTGQLTNWLQTLFHSNTDSGLFTDLPVSMFSE